VVETSGTICVIIASDPVVSTRPSSLVATEELPRNSGEVEEKRRRGRNWRTEEK